jgi:hypothetical protein
MQSRSTSFIFGTSKIARAVITGFLALSISSMGPSFSNASVDNTAPTISNVLNREILPADVATWTAPTTTATDNVDGDISANITSTYSSSDAGSAVTDRASARTHLGTVGNTVTVTYNVSDAAGKCCYRKDGSIYCNSR